MASQYEGLNDWLDGRGAFIDIDPVTTGTEFTVDSLTYATTDDILNAKVTGVTSNDIYDPGIPPKVAYQGNLCTVTALDKNSLHYCTEMVRAEVPFTVTLVDDYAFYGDTKLKTLKLHEGVKLLDQFSISHIDELTILSIPASVDSISGTFVTYSNNLSHIFVDDGNTKYTSVNGVLFNKNKKRLIAFPNGHSANYIVPDGTVAIGRCSFRGAANLNGVTLPTSLRTIEEDAFWDNSSLTSITVPRGVTTIENSAFGNCTSMTSAELPSTLTTLGYKAFYNTANLMTLTVKNPTPPTCEYKIDPRTHTVSFPFDDSHYTRVQLIVPRGSKAAYQTADTWKNFTNIIEQDFPAEFKRGDVNEDGIVDIDDVTQLISFVLGNGNSINQHAGDVNEDGIIDIDDITVIINFILNGVWPEPADIDLWYLTGNNVGNSPWGNVENGLGNGLIPLYPSGTFNAQGKGLLTYTGFFDASDWLYVIHTPGSWDEWWGVNNNNEFGMGEGYEAFRAPTSGYYTISLNTATNQFSFTPYTGSTPAIYSSMNMPGEYSSWIVTDYAFNMTNVNPLKENHDWWMQSVTYDYDGELKFAADNDWDANWGADTFPYGIGVQGGLNIPVKAGTYNVFFNDITGHYNFIRK